MTDNITLSRAVVEQVREALESLCQYDRHGEPLANIDVAGIKAADALDAALAEPVHPGYIIGSHWLETAYSRIAAGEAEADVLAEVLGARGWVKPEPATEAELSAALTANHIPPGWWFIFNKGFRAAERFHGITKEDK